MSYYNELLAGKNMISTLIWCCLASSMVLRAQQWASCRRCSRLWCSLCSSVKTEMRQILLSFPNVLCTTALLKITHLSNTSRSRGEPANLSSVGSVAPSPGWTETAAAVELPETEIIEAPEIVSVGRSGQTEGQTLQLWTANKYS